MLLLSITVDVETEGEGMENRPRESTDASLFFLLIAPLGVVWDVWGVGEADIDLPRDLLRFSIDVGVYAQRVPLVVHLPHTGLCPLHFNYICLR
jgi:hypothetical protein